MKAMFGVLPTDGVAADGDFKIFKARDSKTEYSDLNY
jgi:hypothetical protein